MRRPGCRKLRPARGPRPDPRRRSCRPSPSADRRGRSRALRASPRCTAAAARATRSGVRGWVRNQPARKPPSSPSPRPARLAAGRPRSPGAPPGSWPWRRDRSRQHPDSGCPARPPRTPARASSPGHRPGHPATRPARRARRRPAPLRRHPDSRRAAGRRAGRQDPDLPEPSAIVALRCVPPRHVADLVAEHARELGLVVGQRHQAARYVDIAAWQRESVDDVAVEQREGERLALELGGVLHPLADPLDIGAELRVL